MESQRSIADWASSIGISADPMRSVERAAEEMDEALGAMAAGEIGTAAPELADVAICLYVAAARMGVDLHAEIDAKMKINRARKWRIDATGCAYHIPK